MENQKLLTAEATQEQEKFIEPTFDDIAAEVRAKHGLSEGQVVEGYGTEGQVGYVDSIDPMTGKAQVKVMNREAAEARAPKTVEEVSEIAEPRDKRLQAFDEVAERRSRKFSRRAVAVAAGVAAFVGAGVLPPAGESTAPHAVAQEQITTDPGITPFKSEEAKAAATWGTPEYMEQQQFGDAQRSWEVEGKTDKWKLSAPLNNETPQSSIDSLLEQAKTNVDLLATMAIGCELADCSAANELADKLAKGTPAERSELHAQIAKKFADETPTFGIAHEYATPYIDAEDEEIGYNEHRITNGVQTVEVSFGKWNTDCGQFVIEGEQQIQESGIRTLPVVDVPENEITTVTPADSPTNLDIPFVPDTPSEETTPETPNTPNTPDTPPEEDTPPTTTPPEEEPPVVAKPKDEDKNHYNHAPKQSQNGDDRFENSPETPDRSDELEPERGEEPARPVGEGAAEGTTPVAPEQNEQIQPEQGTNTPLTPEQQQELIDQGAGELEDGEGNNGRIGE